MTYIVVRQFVSGILKGITISTESPVAFEAGKTYKAAGGGSDFLVVSCKPSKQ